MKRCLVIAALHWVTATQAMDWKPDPAVPLQVQVAETIQAFRDSDPGLQRFFDEACAIAVFPRVWRAGLAFGFGGGRGLLLQEGSVRGEVSQGAFSMGLQAGGQAFRQLIFFRTCEAARQFTDHGNLGAISGRVELAGRATAQAGSAGAFTDPGFTPEVAIFSLSRGGLMLDLSAAGVRYVFSPIGSN